MKQGGGMYGLDLFSGIGGITKALDGYVQPVAYCEIEPYARGVLLSRMADGSLPSAPIWDDIRTLSGNILPQIDIIYGGFPCQDISLAGRGEGPGGKRSGLFFEIVRLIGETRPGFVFLENVPAIRTRGLGRVVKELAALGYDCRWTAISAADVGANHRRQRWWLLAHAECSERWPITQGWDEPHGCDSGREETASGFRECRQDVADTSLIPERERADQANAITRSGDARLEPSGGSWWSTEPNVGRVANGVPKRVDRLRALGNAVVPVQAREAFERLTGLK